MPQKPSRPSEAANDTPPSASRPKALVLDVDGVLYARFFLLEASRFLGIRTYLRALALCIIFDLGWISLETLLRKTFLKFAGMSSETVGEIYRNMPLTRGTREFIRAAQERGYEVILLSSGVPELVLKDLGKRLGVSHCAGIDLEIRDGVLTGEVTGTLATAEGKENILEELLKQLGIAWNDVLVVADDRNNKTIIERAGRSIGFRADHVVRKIATHLVETRDITDAIPLLNANEAPFSHRRRRIAPELFRKALHSVAAVVPCAYARWPVLTTVGLLCIASLYLLAEVFRVNGLTFPIIGHINRWTIRKNEIRRIACAPLTLTLGVLLCLFLLPWRAATAGVWVVAIGDTVASLAGQLFGKHTLPGARDKTFEGALSGWLAATCALVLILPPCVAMMAAAVGMLVESYSSTDFDNLTAPLAAGLACAAFL